MEFDRPKKKSQTLPHAAELIVAATSSQPITGAFRDCAWITLALYRMRVRAEE
jgi:hypothetical protein